MNLQRERELLIKKQEDQNDSQRVRTLQRENTQVGEISKFLELYAGVAKSGVANTSTAPYNLRWIRNPSERGCVPHRFTATWRLAPEFVSCIRMFLQYVQVM